MKQDLHPTYYPKAKVTCACGNTWHVGSTVEDIRVNVCSKCHPFYTGQEKIVDTRGRVEKFQKRVAAAKKPATKKTDK
ncbi:MAG: 50S ribosomal protein L31 [Candidatus Pacebacteria bacterium]|nr:50S ribosomal protein L31 [Candidatus Paceibacterota bacterium]